MRHYFIFLFALYLSAFGVMLPTDNVLAKSSTWTMDNLPNSLLGYVWADRCISNCNADIDQWTTQHEWVNAGGISGLTGSISRSATIRNNTTGVTGDTVAIEVGDSITFIPTPDSPTDIYWHTTGGGIDTPYGFWRSDSTMTCDAGTQVLYTTASGGLARYWLYYALNVTPSTVSVSRSGTATLSCANQFNCTVTGPGTINATFTWTATTGKFYHAYTKTGRVNPPSADYLPAATCRKTGAATTINPPETKPGEDYTPPTPYPTYTLNVPAMSINFALTATAAPSVELQFVSFLRTFTDEIKNKFTLIEEVIAAYW